MYVPVPISFWNTMIFCQKSEKNATTFIMWSLDSLCLNLCLLNIPFPSCSYQMCDFLYQGWQLGVKPQSQLRLCLNGTNRTTRGCFMLFTVLGIWTAQSSMLLYFKQHFQHLELMSYFWCHLVILIGTTRNALGWSCWGKETFLMRSTQMPSLGLDQRPPTLRLNWHTVCSGTCQICCFNILLHNICIICGQPDKILSNGYASVFIWTDQLFSLESYIFFDILMG